MNNERKIVKDWMRIPNPFEWKPLEDRLWKFGKPLLPDNPDPRRPEYYIDFRERDEVELFFVNVSEETLPLVTSTSGGFLTQEEDIVTIQSPIYEYHDVKDGEAVLIESFQPMYDTDYIWSGEITVHSIKWGARTFSIMFDPRGTQKVLLWDSGEEGGDEVVKW